MFISVFVRQQVKKIPERANITKNPMFDCSFFIAAAFHDLAVITPLGSGFCSK